MKVTDKPTLQEFHIEGVKHITPENAYEEIADKLGLNDQWNCRQ